MFDSNVCKPPRWSKKHITDKSQAVPGATGSTALHVACANGCIRVVDLLIRNQAHVEVKDKYGSTPLDIAQAKHETEISNLLKSAKLLQHEEYNKVRQPTKQKRRPSLPCIMESKHLPFTITPQKHPSRRSFSGVHRPSMDEMVTPLPDSSNKSSLSIPLSMSSTSSDDSSHFSYASPSSLLGDPNFDWYGYGVLNHYDDENYLQSLERRAYNLELNEQGELERHSQEITRKSHDSTDEDDELEEEEESYMYHHHLDQPEMKRNWFSGFSKDSGRHSFDGYRNSNNHHNNKQDFDHRTGFFSRWTPAWSKK